MKIKFTHKYKHVLIIKGTQGMAMLSLAVVLSIYKYLKSSVPCARLLSSFDAYIVDINEPSADSASCARALSRLWARLNSVRHRASSISCARVLSLLGVLLIAGVSFASMLQLTTDKAHAATSNTLNFQGRLLTASGARVPDGTYNVQFNLYYVSSGGSSQWTETRTNSGGSPVTVQDGYYSVYLGDVTAFSSSIDWSQDLYLGMTIRGTGSCVFGSCTPTDSEMTPRFKLTAVPYAFRASNVASSDTTTASTDSDDVTIQTGDASGATSNSGDITIDTGTATGTAGALLFGTSNASALTIGRSGVTTTIQGSVSLNGSGTALSVTNDATIGGTLGVTGLITASGGLTVTNGDTFTNAGATLNTATAISNLASGGNIGSAATTVDVATTFNVNQTTASQTLTLPAPTVTTAGRIAYVNNVGSASFTMYGSVIGAGQSNAFIWNGSSWVTTVSLSGSVVNVIGTLDSQTKSADGAVISSNAIYLQTADATYAGLVSTGAQTFAGAKTFGSDLIVNGNTTIGNASSDTLTVNATSTFNASITLAANQSLTVTGGNTASRPGTPAEGMVYFDTTTDQLLVYANGKWQADRSPATKIVAASNSSQAVKDAADYVADGNTGAGGDGDQVQINAAITAAAGGTVYLAEGTYTIDAAITVANNTIISGAGRGTIITLPNTFNSSIDIFDDGTGTDTNVTIRDLYIDGNRANQSSGTMNGIGFSTIGSGSGTSTVPGLSVENVTIENMRTYGIYLSAATHTTINKATVIDSGSHGIYAVSSGQLIISNSNLQANDYGVFLTEATYSTVTGNEFSSNTTGGIYVDAVGANTYNSITANVMQNPGTNGIRIVNADGNTVTGNVINGAGSYGIDLTASDYNIVSGNKIYNSGTDGILISSSDSNNITSNIIRDSAGSGYAINISSSSSDSNSLIGNTYSGTGATSNNNSGTGTVMNGQLDSSNNLELQTSGSIELLSNTAITGTLSVSGLTTITTLGSADTNTYVCRNSSSQLATCSSTPLTNSLTDNVADAFDLQEGTNNYININTTNSSENISFGNATTNPDFSFLGSGTLTVAGGLEVTSGTVYVEQSGSSFIETYDYSGGGGNDIALRVRSDAAYAIELLNAAGNQVFSAGQGYVDVGGASVAGNLSIFDGSSNYTTITSAAQTGNYTLTIPALTGNTSFCLLSNNCGYVSASLTDNITDALDLQEGTNNYININTTNSSENISFGNATTNPSYSFLGSGTLSVAGPATVNGLLTGSLGLTVTGAAANINASSNFTTNINTGTSTGAVNIGNNTGNTALTLDSGTGTIAIGTGAQARTINLGTGAAAQTLNIGSLTGAGVTTINAGTGTASGDLNIQAAAAGIINIGNNAVTNKVLNLGSTGSTNAASTVNIATTNANQTQSVTIGNTGSANNVISIQGGSSSTAIRLFTAAGGTISIGATNNSSLNLNTAAVAGTTTIGGTTTTGTITLGQSTASNTISIGSAAGNGNTQTISIGASATAGSTTNVTVGSAIAGTVTLQGNVAVPSLSATTGTTFVCRNGSNLLAACTNTPLTSSLTDNIADAFDLQEGTNNYININTTNSSENISFGNATTNPSYNFLGAGTLAVAGAQTIGGNLAVDTDTLYVDAASDFVAIGTTSAANSRLNVAENAGAANSGSIIQASGTLGYTTGAGELQYAFKTFSNVTPTTAASGSYFGGVFGPQGTSTTNLTNATIGGVYGIGTYTGASGSLGDAIGGRFTVNNSAAGTITRAYGLQIPNFTNPSGTISNRAGLQIDGFTTASTNSTLVLLGTNTIPTGDFSIYNASAQDNVFQGNLAIGTTTAPTVALDVTGDGLFSGNLTVNGNTTIGNAVTDNLTVTAAIQGTSALLFDGSTDDTNETTLSITNPTADRTQTLQDNSGVIPLGTAGNTLFFTTSGATNVTLPTSGTLTTNPASGSYLMQVPTSTAANTITPTTNSVVGLTVNGTSGTAATAVSIVQGGAATALQVNGTSTGSVLDIQDGGTSVLTVADGGVTTITANGGTGVALTVNNGTSTGNILNIADGGTNIATFADGGAVLFKNTTNSTAAFQVQPSGSTTPSFVVDSTNNRVGIGTSAPTSTLMVAGNQSTTAFSTSGMALRVSGATYTDTGTAASGTVAFAAGTSYGIPTFAASNTGVTYTNSATLYISDAPTAGTNVTLTNRYALYVASGNSIFGGDITTSTNLAVNGNTTIGNAIGDNLTVTAGIQGTSALSFEGSTDDGTNITTFSVTNPTAARTQTIQDNSGVLPLGTAGNTLFFTTSGATSLTLPTSGTVTTNPASGSYLMQVPTTTAANTITPATTGVVGLTVNGTNTGTAATALAVAQTGAATAVTISQSAVANGLEITSTNASQVSSTALSVTQSGTSTGFTGNFVNFTGSSTTGSGNLLNLTSVNTTAGNALNVTANSITTGNAINVNSTGTGLTSGSLLYLTSATTGAIATNGIVSLNASGNYTSTSNVGLLNVSANSTTAGTIASFNGNALTTGVGVRIASTGTGLTSGSLLRVSTATTGAIATNGAIQLTASGNYTSTSNVGLLSVQANSTAAGTIQNINGNALTTGQALYVGSTGTGLTSGSLLYLTSATTGAIATNGIVSLNASGNYTSTSNVGLLNVSANSTTAGTVANISGTAVTTGTVLQVTGSTATTNGLTLNVTSGRVQFTPTNTIASAAGATWNGINVPATTATLSGSTSVTTATGFNLLSLAAPTITSGSALTVTNAATSYIGGAPIQAGSTTITNAYSLWVDSGRTRLDGDLVVDTDTLYVDSTSDYVSIGGTTDAGAKLNIFTSNSGYEEGLRQTDGTISLVTAVGFSQAYLGTESNHGLVLFANSIDSFGVTNANVAFVGSSVAGASVATGAGDLYVTDAVEVDGAALFQNSTDSTTAFQILESSGAGGSSLLTADTTNFLLKVAPTQFTSSGSTQSFATSGSVTGVDSYSTIAVNATVAGVTVTVPSPVAGGQVVGRVLYVAAVNNSEDFALSLSGTSVEINMKENSTATLIWNGTGWTAAGASSSTDLQAAYDNTAATAGGAEIVLASSGTGGLTIRNDATTAITGGLLEVQTAIGSNLFTVNNNATEYAANGGAESSTFTAWAAAPAGGTVTRYTTVGDNIATGAGSVYVNTTSTANTGAKNTLTASLTANLRYKVSYTARHTSSTSTFTTLETYFSNDGTTAHVECGSDATIYYNKWTRVDCTFTPTSVGASNAIIFRHSDAVEHDFYIDNFSVTVDASSNHAVDGDVDSALGTNWQAYDADGGAGTTTPTRDTSNIYNTSGAVAVATTGPAANLGVRNNMAITPTVSTQYLVTFYAKLASGSFTDITVGFLPAGGSSTPVAAQLCTDYNTQTLSTSSWTKITCLVTTPSSGISDPDLVIYQPTSGARTFYIDALKITLNTNNSSNVQVGGGQKGGPTTLFTLDRSYGAPIADNNDAYLGSMYYDTSTGRIQCYEADGWGACGAAPDNIVNLNPEYAGAVLNGSGVGTMTADFCSNDAQLSVNSTLCDSGEAKNYYRWTSPQATQQTYSIYVTYQLPATFNGFSSDDTVQLVARTDSTTNAAVTYEMYKSTGSDVTQCGSGETTVVTVANDWQSVGINGNESTGCSFSSSSASNFIIFKLNLKANSNANAYVSTLSFTTTGR